MCVYVCECGGEVKPKSSLTLIILSSHKMTHRPSRSWLSYKASSKLYIHIYIYISYMIKRFYLGAWTNQKVSILWVEVVIVRWLCLFILNLRGSIEVTRDLVRVRARGEEVEDILQFFKSQWIRVSGLWPNRRTVKFLKTRSIWLINKDSMNKSSIQIIWF